MCEAFAKPLLPWQSNKCYIFVCARACVRAYGQAHGRYHAQRACSLAYPACKAYVPYCDVICDSSGSTVFFQTLSHKRHDFRKIVIEHKMCESVFRFSLKYLSKTFLILERIQRDIVINVKTSSYKVPLILIRF